MSCKLPINIKANGKYDNCISRCSYEFNYATGVNTWFTKSNSFIIEINVEANDKDDVKINGTQVGTPVKIVIYKKSLHLYDGKHADAELIIEHREGNYIVIPITRGTSNNNAAYKFINHILRNTPPSRGGNQINEVQTGGANLSLNDIVPRGEYFFHNCDGGNVIVFHANNGIKLDDSTINLLNTVIKKDKDVFNFEEGENNIIPENYKDSEKHSKIIVYRNGPKKEGFISKMGNFLGINKREGFSELRGAKGPEGSSNYVHGSCEYKGSIKKESSIVRSNNMLESIRWWAISIFIILGALLTAILIYFYISDNNNPSTGSLVEDSRGGSGITA